MSLEILLATFLLAIMRSMTHKQYSRGFTIVELLIVIVIIGILATLVGITYNGVVDSANYARTRDSIVKVEKAFRLKAIADGMYQQDTYYKTCTGDTDMTSNNVWISDILESCHDANPLANFLQSADYYDAGVPLVYDNDRDTYTMPCDANATKGVNVYFAGLLGVSRMTQLDTDIDSGNGLLCGRVRTNGTQEYFMLAAHSTEGL